MEQNLPRITRCCNLLQAFQLVRCRPCVLQRLLLDSDRDTHLFSAFCHPAAGLKLLLSSTHLRCPITEMARRTKPDVSKAGRSRACRPSSSALAPIHWWLCCVHVSGRLAALAHNPFLCFSGKRILTFLSFKDQSGHMLDVGAPLPMFNSAF